MKPYYRKNGFLDLGERFSNWIDSKIWDIKFCYRQCGILYYIPGFRSISITKKDIENWKLDREYVEKKLRESIDLYNREKYWWMKRK